MGTPESGWIPDRALAADHLRIQFSSPADIAEGKDAMTRGIKGPAPANIMKHLKRMQFPADKGKILSHAERGPGPNTKMVVEILNRIPEKEYRSPAEIVAEIGRIKRDGPAGPDLL